VTARRALPRLLAAALLACAGAPAGFAAIAAVAGVTVRTGPTPIIRGDARASGDITVSNDKLAFALAVQTPVPYGVPRGALVDLAPVRDGKVGRDRVVYADFIPDNWSAWPNTYQKVEVLERGPARAVVRSIRDWGAVTITTTYTLLAGADHVVMHTAMRNDGPVARSGLLSGFTLWPNSGHRFGVPGLGGLEHGSAAGALADRTVAYDEDWMVALHAPYLTHIAHGSLDLYQQHSLAPGESRSFEAWLQVGASGDLAPVFALQIERARLPYGSIHGTVTGHDGRPLAQPVVIVEKSGQPYGWALGARGAYALRLPVGTYTLYATARNHSQTASSALSVTSGGIYRLDFRGVAASGHVHFSVAEQGGGQPLDARIAICAGQQPLVEFLGRRTFFTQLEPRGQADLTIAPGPYTFCVSSGGGFTMREQQLQLQVEPGRAQRRHVSLDRLFDPAAKGWYGADLHHHADQAEAVTPPAELARSQLASGLDLLFVSDHDSLANLPALQQIAARRGVPFIPGIELSPSWGHFNAYPIDAGKRLAIDTGTASVQEIFAEARRLGAGIVQVNHPLIPYGYFTSVANGQAPGGFDPDFDLVEINATESDTDAAVLGRVWGFWNEGRRYYLGAGTDAHDVWNVLSGRVRAYAHIDGTLSTAAYVAALRAGHGYVSYGPLIYPAVEFGNVLHVRPGEAFALAFELESLPGLRYAELVSGGASVARRNFADAPLRAHADFSVRTAHAAWYALSVEDAAGRRAYTDPVWVETAP
jgi:hypothetical protein